MIKTKILLRLAILLLLLTVGVNIVWAAGFVRTLTNGFTLDGYYLRAFYDFQNNNPSVLPTSEDLRYRAVENGTYWGLHNYGSGTRSAVINISVRAGEVLVLQQYDDNAIYSINRGAWSSTSTYPLYNITETAENITITIPRYGGVVAAAVMSKYYYTFYASDGTNTLSTLQTGMAEINGDVTVTYPQNVLVGTTLYSIPQNNNNPRFKKTSQITSDYYQESLVYSSHTDNVVFYTEGEDVSGVSKGANYNYASLDFMGYTGGSYVDVTTLQPGAYKIYLKGVNGNGASRPVKFSVGGQDVYTLDIPGSNISYYANSSEEIKVNNASTLSFSSAGSSVSGIDWFYIQGVFAFSESNVSYTLHSWDEIVSPPVLLNTTGNTQVTYSESSGGNVVTVDSSTGVLKLRRAGRAIVTVTAGDYTAQYIVTVRSATDASGSLTYDATTHKETFTISGQGNFDVEHFEGQRIAFDIGNPNEVQQVNGDGLYCITGAGGIYASSQSGVPNSGTYFVFTPKASGVLSITGTSGEYPFNIHLVNSAGEFLEENTKSTTSNTVTPLP